MQEAGHRKQTMGLEAINYSRSVWVLILSMGIIRLLLAFLLELGNDEAYYWLYSQYPQWNYFDHPPMVSIWIRIFSFNLAFEQWEGFLRLGSVIGGCLSTWFIYRATSLIHSPEAGWFAALLYSASFYAGITAGLYILPDSPQMVFWTFSLWMIARIMIKENSWVNWIAFGLSAALCIMSKVHGVFIWMGMVGYILFLRRNWLRLPQLYLAGLLTLLIISPIFFWNYHYDFATYRFHSSRVEIDQVTIRWNSLLKEIISQIFFNNPLNFFLILTSLIALIKGKWKPGGTLQIFLFSGLSLAFLLILISIFRDSTLPHWSGPAYVTLMPVAAVWLAEVNRSWFPTILRWAVAIFLLVYLVWISAIHFYPGTWGSRQPEKLGKGDITLDMYGWREASKQFQKLYQTDVLKGIMPARAPLVASHWWGAHIEYYFAHPLGLKLIGMGDPSSLHQYLWINKWRQGEVNTDQVYCIIPSNDFYQVPSAFYQRTELAWIIHIIRNGKPAHDFRIYRLKGRIKEIPVVSN